MNYKKIAKTTAKWAIVLTGGYFIGTTATKYIEPPEFIDLLAEYTQRFTEQSRFMASNVRTLASPLEKKTAANQYLHNFPTNIPGAGTITRYEVDGAKHCLVHIRQLHHPPLDSLRFGKKRTPIIAVQQDIYAILSHLIQKSKLTNVYEEGIYVPEGTSKDTVEGLLYLRQQKQDLKKSDTTLRKKCEELSLQREKNEKIYTQICINSPKMSQELFNWCQRYEPIAKLLEQVSRDVCGKYSSAPSEQNETEKQGEELYRQGAADVLFFERKVDLKAAETANARKQGRFEPREDALLEIVAKDAPTYAVAVYGGGHDFGDNIERWNTAHPHQKFSFIEITPTAYFTHALGMAVDEIKR